MKLQRAKMHSRLCTSQRHSHHRPSQPPQENPLSPPGTDWSEKSENFGVAVGHGCVVPSPRLDTRLPSVDGSIDGTGLWVFSHIFAQHVVLLGTGLRQAITSEGQLTEGVQADRYAERIR